MSDKKPAIFTVPSRKIPAAQAGVGLEALVRAVNGLEAQNAQLEGRIAALEGAKKTPAKRTRKTKAK